MSLMILGLVLFLGVHSTRIVAEGWRKRTIDRLGLNGWKAAYSVVSLVGFALIVVGFGQARQQPSFIWQPPVGMRHAASLLTLIAFILLAAAYVPRNAIKARLHHPMVLAVKAWALAHLLSNGNLAHLVLFGSFLLWAVLDFRAARQRDRTERSFYPPGNAIGTALTLVIGLGAWAGFALWGHGVLIGVRPFG